MPEALLRRGLAEKGLRKAALAPEEPRVSGSQFAGSKLREYSTGQEKTDMLPEQARPACTPSPALGELFLEQGLPTPSGQTPRLSLVRISHRTVKKALPLRGQGSLFPSLLLSYSGLSPIFILGHLLFLTRIDT